MPPELHTDNKMNFLKGYFNRFLVTYLVILTFPFPANYISWLRIINKWYYSILNIVVSWVGRHMLKISYPLIYIHNGSSDTSFHYVQLFFFVCAALLIAFVWYFVDKTKPHSTKLLSFTTAYLHFYFALTMMRFGLEKIIKVQFPFPYESIDETYGESSPMKLMWNFMGFSSTYNLFIGFLELLSGFFVFFKRWIALGGLLSITLLMHIVILNFCFDIPVKLFAINFLIMAIFISAPYIQMFINLFVRLKPTYPIDQQSQIKHKQGNKISGALKFAIIVGIIYSMIGIVRTKYVFFGDGAFAKTPLFGIYRTELFIRNSDTLLPLLTDNTQWKTVSIIYKNKATLRLTNDTVKACKFVTDTVHKNIQFSYADDSAYSAKLKYIIPDSNHLYIEGRLRGDSIRVLLKKQDLNKYTLINRGFHWINESPFYK